MKYLILALTIASCGTGNRPSAPVYSPDAPRTSESEFISYDLMPGHCEFIKEINTLICSPEIKGYDDE